jgi:glycosyltransferase involved in cell wall biosynthesis
MGSIGAFHGDRRPKWIFPGNNFPRSFLMLASVGRPTTNPRISVVVPAKNEARNLELVLPQLPVDAEVIVVDGHSTDGTRDVVQRTRPDAKFMQQTRRGKGNALAVGFAAATGDIVVMFDADGSADVREIDRFVDALLDGADFAKGSRVLAGGGSVDITPIRDLGNRSLTGLTNLAFGTRYTDLCYGYNAFWRDILPHLDLPGPEPISGEMVWGDGFEIETVINCRVAATKLSVTEVPSMEQERRFGESNLHAVRDGIRVLKTLWAERMRMRRTVPAVVARDRAIRTAPAFAPSQRVVVSQPPAYPMPERATA